MSRLSPEMVDTQMQLCARDREYAYKLGATKLRGLVRHYQKLHPGYTTNGQYDDKVYRLVMDVMYIVEGLKRAAKGQAKMRRQGLA